MAINRNVLKATRKWIGKLGRTDAEYFLDLGTVKDLAVFCALHKSKGLDFKDQFEAEVATYRYLQVIMIMNTISEDSRDQLVADRFLTVPFHIEEITKGRRPYINEELIDMRFFSWKQSHLSVLYQLAEVDVFGILESTPEELKAMMLQVIGYYSTPIIGFCTVKGVRPRDFSFKKEFRELLGYIIDTHFSGPDIRDPQVRLYVEAMMMVTQRRKTCLMFK